MGGGIRPVLVDVYDRERLIAEMRAFSPDLVMHQLTDLPHDPSRLPDFVAANAHIRREGTDNLLEGARQAGAERFLAQSVAWTLEGEGAAAVAHLESAVLQFGGTVLRYGRLYGPGTYAEREPPPPPRVHVDRAVQVTLGSLEAGPGVLEIVETGHRCEPARLG